MKKKIEFENIHDLLEEVCDTIKNDENIFYAYQTGDEIGLGFSANAEYVPSMVLMLLEQNKQIAPAFVEGVAMFCEQEMLRNKSYDA